MVKFVPLLIGRLDADVITRQTVLMSSHRVKFVPLLIGRLNTDVIARRTVLMSSHSDWSDCTDAQFWSNCSDCTDVGSLMSSTTEVLIR